ncbi:MAG: ABC transporter substrate-binding protein [Treponema sp.]
MKKVFIIMAMLSVTLSLFAAGKKEEKAAHEQDKSRFVTIENFNRTTEYSKVPERVLPLSLGEAEMLAALGLTDKIIAVGIGHDTLESILPEYRNLIQGKPVMKEISLEYILSLNPDFIFTTAFRFFLDGFGTYDDYKKNNVRIYVTEGSYVENCSLENTYNDILNIGAIFRVEQRAQTFVDKLKQREKAVTEKIKKVKPIKCCVFDSNEGNTLFTAGGTGLEHDIITRAGGINIFASIDQHFAPGSIEQIIKENPDVFIIHEYEIAESGTHYLNDGQQKIEYLKNKKELAEVSAIKNNRFIVIPLCSVFPGVQNLNALETIAKGLHPEYFN